MRGPRRHTFTALPVDLDLDAVAALDAARARLARSELERRPRLRTIAQLRGELESRIVPEVSVVGLRRGVRPVLDPDVVARVGPVRDEDLPPFVRGRLRYRVVDGRAVR